MYPYKTIRPKPHITRRYGAWYVSQPGVYNQPVEHPSTILWQLP